MEMNVHKFSVKPKILLVVLEFNATLTAKVISWRLGRSVTHMCFLAFSHKY